MANFIDYKTVRECFNYNPGTGMLTLRKPRGLHGIFKEGAEVGRIDKSGTRRSVKLYLRTYMKPGFIAYVHRIIWVWMTGEQPDTIDHIDGNGLNNKWSNLRSVPFAVNGRNQKLHSTNTSGTSGVTYRKDSGKWRSRMMVDGEMISLGTFADKQEAVNARSQYERSIAA